MSQKLCPQCPSESLTVTPYRQEAVDVCRRCAGMWFEESEINRVISEVDNGEDNADISNSLSQQRSKTLLRCPDCNIKLKRAKLLDNFDLELDACPSCDGVWIGNDEIEKVEHSPRLRQALSEINQKVSVKSWLFQTLVRFPVEYNIKPHRVPIVTWSLVVLNTLFFWAYFGSYSDTEWVFAHFASRPADLAQGNEWWTLLSATFLHGDILHLLGNMYFLLLIGDNLEDVLGRWRYLGIYLVCGIGAGIISTVANWNSEIMSVGASGAIAALFAMYLVWFRFASLSFMFIIYQKKLSPVWYFAIWLVIDNLLAMLLDGQGVDYWAHLGGFAVGLAFGLGLKEWVYQTNPVVRILAQNSVKVNR
ncbi:rhomboid family intramembrane serine protease [uncultured Ferrimonas sp.]|uniref:rhomboid family intramembrane serine protease n=1 Tax=uncultured Ferrimonas sp. TaxID=432640 RepID=UPI002609E1E8|nr:rhomboid family intramembrane serine protease [uncultured Ferrimonas sp.]